MKVTKESDRYVLEPETKDDHDFLVEYFLVSKSTGTLHLPRKVKIE